MSQTISEVVSKIRDYIIRPIGSNWLSQNRADWNSLCSALDVMGDTELGMDAYSSEKWPSSDGASYVVNYGVLQLLFVQQDAVEQICKVLKVDLNEDETNQKLLKDIRQIRNESIGHPVKQGKNSSHFISRWTLSKNGFKLLSFYEGNAVPQCKDVDIPPLIQQQQSLLVKMLEEIVKQLEEREVEHKRKFQEIKLKNFLKLNYPLAKLDDEHLGGMHRQEIWEALSCFQTKLQERGEDNDLLNEEFEKVFHALGRLDSHFSLVMHLDDKDIEIYRFFLEEKIKEFNQKALQVDAEYASENP